jgi:hypothetical protein
VPNRVRLVDVSLSGVSGVLQTIGFTGIAPGAFNYNVTIVTCSDIHGVALPNCQVAAGGIQVEGP